MKIFEKDSWWKSIDLTIFMSSFLIAALGWVALLSVTSGGWDLSRVATRQGAYLVVGFLVMIGLSTLDYRKLRKLAWPGYVASLGLLILVMIPGVGQTANGAQRWISLGPLGTLQPSEPAKLATFFLLAHVLAAGTEQESGFTPLLLFKTLGLAAVPFALIAAQPDLGTSLVILACAFVLLYQAGANVIHLLGIITAGLGVLPLILKEYQRTRLIVFTNPEIDPQGAGYNIVQSLTAIGSGGTYGRGLFEGPLSQHGFVPENRTDFIITVIGEEMGLVATLGLLLLCLLLLLSLARVLLGCESKFGALLCAGCITVFGFQTVVNIGMTLGLLPVVGLPLPLVSYGGSAMLTNFAALGLVGSVARVHRRPRFARHILES